MCKLYVPLIKIEQVNECSSFTVWFLSTWKRTLVSRLRDFDNGTFPLTPSVTSLTFPRNIFSICTLIKPLPYSVTINFVFREPFMTYFPRPLLILRKSTYVGGRRRDLGRVWMTVFLSRFCFDTHNVRPKGMMGYSSK